MQVSLCSSASCCCQCCAALRCVALHRHSAAFPGGRVLAWEKQHFANHSRHIGLCSRKCREGLGGESVPRNENASSEHPQEMLKNELKKLSPVDLYKQKTHRNELQCRPAQSPQSDGFPIAIQGCDGTCFRPGGHSQYMHQEAWAKPNKRFWSQTCSVVGAQRM